MKKRLQTLINKFELYSATHRSLAFILAGVLVVGTVGSGLLIYNHSSKAKAEEVATEPSDITVESVEVMPEIIITEAQIYSPKFVRCNITTESVEKDLTIYISDENDECIKGTQFKVKLIDPKDNDKIEEYIQSIETLNAQIGDACVGVEEITDENVIKLCQDKEVALMAYNMALNDIEGDTYVDEDADGKIALSNMTPGDYTAVLVEEETLNPEYQLEPAGYAVAVNVKDKLEYKAVKEIKKKVEVYVAKEDVKSQAATEEAKLKDTVAFVESSKKENKSSNATTDIVKPSATAAKYTVTASDKSGASVTFKVAVPTSTPSATPTSTPSVTPTNTPSATPSVTPSATPDPTEVPDANQQPNNTENKTEEQTTTTSPTPTEGVQSGWVKMPGAMATVRPVALKMFMSAANTEQQYKEETASIDMSLSGDTFTITSNGNVSNICINNTAVSGNNYRITAAGTYTLTATATASDKTTKNLSVTYTVAADESAKQPLKDNKGNELFLDAECTKPAYNTDYKDGMTCYTKQSSYTYYGWQNINGATYYYNADGKYVTGEQVINGASYTFDGNGVLQNQGTGIDVSKFQGNIDWAQVKGSVSYAIIRCGGRYKESRGLYEDPKFYANMSGAKGQGIPVGIYFYSTAVNEYMAVEEASLAVSMANKAGGCSLPIYIDMEDSLQAGLTNEQRTNIINAFCSTVSNSGYRTGVYANYQWFSKKINVGDIPSSYNIWIARYNTTLGYSGRYNMWQYSSKGTVPGIKGNVDMNRTN